MEPRENDAPLNQLQRKEVSDMLSGYWGADQVQRLASAAAGEAVVRMCEQSIAAKVKALADDDVSLKTMLDNLFRQGGMVVKTEASKHFDALVCEVLKDEDSGVPSAIRQYTKDHLTELVQRSVSEIVTAMVIDYLKTGHSSAASATHEMIRQAFMNARMQPGY